MKAQRATFGGSYEFSSLEQTKCKYMLPAATVRKIIPILRHGARRALKMKVRGFPRPYYCSFVMRDTKWFNTWAGSGSVYRRRSDHVRNVYCDLRVGSHRYDQVMHGGIYDNDEELESVSHVRVPIDDKNYDGLKLSLWRLSECKFREALSDHNHKEALRLSTVDPSADLRSFVKNQAIRVVRHGKPEAIDEERFVRFCKKASAWMADLPKIAASWVEFDASQETKIFVNTEGSIIVQPTQIFSVVGGLRRLNKDGSYIDQEIVINCGRLRELPDMRQFKKQITEKYEQLLNLINARKIHSFSGPVLLYPQPAGVLVHEAIGHRLEGSRLLSTGEGGTFKDQIGKQILNVELSIRDNPRLREFRGVRCIGAYDYDDEGTPACDTTLVKDGMLVDFLNTRQAPIKHGFRPNGHARNRKFERPISRMGVTIVEGKKTLSHDSLKQLLIAEVKRQKKPFGMIVYETSGGETETTRYDFQAFSGEISFATLVYPNGNEICVKGVNFVGTPLQALNNIIAIGNELHIENGYCGAESGYIPVTTISPALLLRSLELQAKEEELVTQYILPRPR